MPVLRNVVGESSDRGKLLLCCVCAYVELDLLASFDIHTDETVQFGRQVADRFVELVNVSKFTLYTTLYTMCIGH